MPRVACNDGVDNANALHWQRRKCRLHDRRDRVLTDAPNRTVSRSKPESEHLGTLAGIAADAAKRDVLAADQRSVVDDVFPGRTVAPRRGLGE